MGRRRSARLARAETPLRRSARLRDTLGGPVEEVVDMSAEQSEGEDAQDLQPRPGIRAHHSASGDPAPVEPEPESELEEPEARGRGRPRQHPQLDSMCPSVILRRLDLEDREGEETEPPRAAAPKAPTSRIPTFQSSGARLLRPVDRPPPGKPPPSQLPVRPWERAAKPHLEMGWSDTALSPRPALRAETGTPRPEAAQEAGAGALAPETRGGQLERGTPAPRAEATSREASKTQPRRGPPVPSEAEPREDTPPASEEGGEEAEAEREEVGSEAEREEVGSEAEREEAGSEAEEEEVGSEAEEKEAGEEEVDSEAEEEEVGSEAEEEEVDSEAEEKEVDSEAGEEEAEQEEAAPEAEAEGEEVGSEAEAEREAVVFEVGARSEKPALNPRGRRAAGGREARQEGAGRPGPRGRLRRYCSTLLCLLPPLLLLLGGGGLFLWPSGRPGLAGALLAPLDLDWLWAGDLWARQEACGSDCSLSLLESLPEGLEYPPGSPRLTPISQAWRDLLHRANHSVSIAAFYLTLRDTDLEASEPSALEGKRVFEALRGLPARGVGLRIAVNSPQTYPRDTDDLALAGAEVRPVYLQNLTGGILHTKLWEVDGQHAYLGSANMDWRSLTQVKELAVSVTNCSCLARDVSRLFQAYWLLGSPAGGAVPARWPRRLSALSSAQRPLQLQLNGLPAQVYLSSAPPPLSADGRTDDLSAILGVISDARRFVYVSVMDFLPASQYTEPAQFWPPIDSALRAAACARGVEVRLLVSCWPHSDQPMFVFLESLGVPNHPPLSCRLHVKVFEVPSTEEQKMIPYARVNHAKYMVTDRVAYIGTSNWSENYFTHTAGVGLVVNQTGAPAGAGKRSVQSDLQAVFERDWDSGFAQPLSSEPAHLCGARESA
ncbi:5'-3' exonuclease PLD4 isoform X2 [Lepisosteus oculatus]|uniref:5'-3' exonuclease PLD4 isoform X2 n=1 Tax=Lepisosteus oculatus TaxID=7918 RepID=UPI0035F513F4